MHTHIRARNLPGLYSEIRFVATRPEERIGHPEIVYENTQLERRHLITRLHRRDLHNQNFRPNTTGSIIIFHCAIFLYDKYLQ